MEFANYTNLKNSPLITSEISEGDMKHKFTNAHYTGLHIDHRRGYVLMGGGIVRMYLVRYLNSKNETSFTKQHIM